MTEIISVISGKGGVGKTTFTSNIGLALAGLGKNVLLVDGNVSGANLGLHFGVDTYKNSLNDVLEGKIDFHEAIHNLKSLGISSEYLHLIPASVTMCSADLSRLKDLFCALVGHYDYIIIDGAAGCDSEVESVLDVSDKVIIITNPEVSSLSNAILVRAIAEDKDKEIIGVVINRVHGDYFEISIPEIEKFTNLPVIGVIRNGRHVSSALADSTPVLSKYPESRVSKDFRQTASNLVSGSYDVAKNDSLLSRVRDAIVERKL